MATNAENAPKVYEDYKIEDATIKKITRVVDNGDERISFELDKDFISFDFKTKEEITTNKFSLAAAEVSRQLVPLVDEFALADAYLMGSNVPSTLVSLVLRGAKVNINRVFKKKGEKRENSSDTYTMDLYKSVFESIETNINPMFAKPIEKELEKISNEEQAVKMQKRAEMTETTTRKAIFGW